MRARPETSHSEDLLKTRPRLTPRSKKVLKCFRCRVAHKACVWVKYGPSNVGSRLPGKCCIPCSKSKERIESCIPIAWGDLPKEQRDILEMLKEADRQRALQKASQESARRERSKSSGSNGKEGNPRQRRPPSPNHNASQQYLAETTQTKQQRASITQTQATARYSKSAEALTSDQSSNLVSQEYMALEQREAQGFFRNANANMSSSSGFPPKTAQIAPSHISPYLQQQLLVPLGTTHATNRCLEPMEYYAPAYHKTTVHASKFQDSPHYLAPPASSSSSSSSSSSILLLAEEKAAHADISLAGQNNRNLRRCPGFKTNKRKSSVAYPKPNSAEGLDDAEGETQSDRYSMSSNASVDGDMDSEVSSESYPREYVNGSYSADRKYRQNKDGREDKWIDWQVHQISEQDRELRQQCLRHKRLNLAWSDVYSQYRRLCAFGDKPDENQKAKKKAARHQKALEEALLLVKKLLYKIHKLAKLADRAGDYCQRVLFRKEILVQLTEHNLWFQDLKQRVSSELLQVESGNQSVIRRTSRRIEILSPLRSAVIEKDVEAIRTCVVEEGGLNEVGPDGKTALVLAVEIEAIDIVTLLVEELHADVDVPRRGLGPTPLHMAILRMNNDIVNLLLKNGARVDIKAPLEKLGQSIMAVDLAAYLADPDIFGDDRIQKSIEKERPNLDPWILGRLYEPQRGLIPPNFREHIANYVKRTAQTPELETADTSLVSMLAENSEGTSFEDIFGFADSENLVEFSGHNTNV